MSGSPDEHDAHVQQPPRLRLCGQSLVAPGQLVAPNFECASICFNVVRSKAGEGPTARGDVRSRCCTRAEELTMDGSQSMSQASAPIPHKSPPEPHGRRIGQPLPPTVRTYVSTRPISCLVLLRLHPHLSGPGPSSLRVPLESCWPPPITTCQPSCICITPIPGTLADHYHYHDQTSRPSPTCSTKPAINHNCQRPLRPCSPGTITRSE